MTNNYQLLTTLISLPSTHAGQGNSFDKETLEKDKQYHYRQHEDQTGYYRDTPHKLAHQEDKESLPF